eukprot:CAMPEP_0184872016 /NCGR_PEP_ID=MMETSP0580-20130426/41046_1 /TAXON_ID=1118495 /ORGANISM="Dactyliosolen fragilissimus" /LENGTH=108 /DNA_ID=CAMNT_0027374749 /DNA_START=82 /DNA_END=408 /DNA_ORIENTATION=+
MSGIRALRPDQKRVWGMGAGVLAFGAVIKFGYFYLSREIIIENLERRDKDARKHLKNSREFASWAAKDRSKRVVPLSPQQKQQLQEYLLLMAEYNHDVYPGKDKRDSI